MHAHGGGDDVPIPCPDQRALFTGVRGIDQPVEKVGVGPVGGTREPETRPKHYEYIIFSLRTRG
jgi:hypothetical protein